MDYGRQPVGEGCGVRNHGWAKRERKNEQGVDGRHQKMASGGRTHTQHHGTGLISMETNCHWGIGHQRAQVHGMKKKTTPWHEEEDNSLYVSTLLSPLYIIIITYICWRSICRRLTVESFVGAGGIPWWSPSQVLATNYCVCSVCVCVELRRLVFIIAVHLGNKVIFYPLSPLTLQVTVNSAMPHRPF